MPRDLESVATDASNDVRRAIEFYRHRKNHTKDVGKLSNFGINVRRANDFLGWIGRTPGRFSRLVRDEVHVSEFEVEPIRSARHESKASESVETKEVDPSEVSAELIAIEEAESVRRADELMVEIKSQAPRPGVPVVWTPHDCKMFRTLACGSNLHEPSDVMSREAGLAEVGKWGWSTYVHFGEIPGTEERMAA